MKFLNFIKLFCLFAFVITFATSCSENSSEILEEVETIETGFNIQVGNRSIASDAFAMKCSNENYSSLQISTNASKWVADDLSESGDFVIGVINWTPEFRGYNINFNNLSETGGTLSLSDDFEITITEETDDYISGSISGSLIDENGHSVALLGNFVAVVVETITEKCL